MALILLYTVTLLHFDRAERIALSLIFKFKRKLKIKFKLKLKLIEELIILLL